MAKWTAAARKAYFKAHPENFAGEDMTYPIKDASDVSDAWDLAGHASDPDRVRAKIKSIAKRLGLEDALPETAKDGGGTRAMNAAQMYVPITRIDKDEWLIEGQATSDAVDHYGTIFDYESSKSAFATWRGNIREMHDPKKAVGRAIEVIPDDENRCIRVRARISKGAKDTWQKVLDGTLSGFSIGAYWEDGKPQIERVQVGGRDVPKYVNHKVAELSLVDSAGSPGCDDIAIVRMAGDVPTITDVLDDSEASPDPEPALTRDGARISHITQDALHGMRNNHLRNAQDTMNLCGCDECKQGASALDPDGDGDIDIMGSTDYLDNGNWRAVEALITRTLAPTVQRVNALSAAIAAQKPVTIPEPQTIDTSAIERRLDAIEQRTSDIAEVRSLVSEVKELAERIAAQPVAGGPVASGAALDKFLATNGSLPAGQMSNLDVIQRAIQMGLLRDEKSQTAAAAVQIEEIMRQHGAV